MKPNHPPHTASRLPHPASFSLQPSAFQAFSPQPSGLQPFRLFPRSLQPFRLFPFSLQAFRLSAFLLTAAFLHGQPDWDAPKITRHSETTGVHSIKSRKFTGIPSVAVTPGGRLWATWYAGKTPGEDHNNYAVLATSADGGKTWDETHVVDPDGEGPLRAFDPQLWMAPDGSLWFFWAVSKAKDTDNAGPDTWFVKTNDPENKNASWSAPRFIAKGVMMNKPLALSTGEWLFPVAGWARSDARDKNNNSAQAYLSRDKGASFSLAGACNVPPEARSYDEHQIVERKDGSLWMFVRTRHGIGESISTDKGKTWSALKPSSIMNTSSRFFFSRLSSGNLLLVKNGPMDIKTGRSHMMAFLSTDDGLSWSRGLLIDERPRTSYPDGQQDKDGRIHIIYDFARTGDQLILKTEFTEADILDPRHDTAMIRVYDNRKTVSKGGVEKPKGAKAAEPVALRDNADGRQLRAKPLPEGALRIEGAAPDTLANGKTLFADRKYTAQNIPPALDGARFLRVRMDGRKTLRCERAGTVCFLTPQPDRNRDNQSRELEAQGFKKVALPEILLFNSSGAAAANCVTLYQKDCRPGEVITFEKWAVPLWFPPSPVNTKARK